MMAAAAAAAVSTGAGHPYSPSTLELPGYVPAFMSQQFILGTFAAVSVIVLALGWIFSGRHKYLSSLERVLVCWWLFTGLIHVVLEGYFVFTPNFFRLPYSNFLAEVWKEYGKGDSRYPGRDTTVVLIEAITAVFEGPGALLAIYAILYRKSYEHPLQLATSLGQVYGDALYFSTVYFLKEDVSAPGFIYFWGYFVFLNSIWLIVPILIIIRSWKHINDAFRKSNTQLKKVK